uniref:Hexosyltransferase n=1 Tax=Strongyloides papillosus TaxID=174720 RepID=A0A0N5BG92_STREA
MEKFERNFFKQKINRNITIYKIPLEKIYSNQLANQSLLSMSFMKNGGNINKNVFKPTFDDKTPEQLSGNTDKFFCSLKYCEIGIMFQKVGSSELNSVDLHKVDNVFYIGFGKIDKYDSLILMKLLRHHDKHTFHVVVCPVEDWIQENSLAEYIVDMENVVDFPKQEKLTLFNFYKILICQKNNVKTFAKCGHINQLYMPPVDVGYKCDKRVVDDDEKNNSTYHRANIDSNYQITYEGKNLLKSTYATYLALSPEKNYKSNITEVNFYNYKSKFYSGQRLIYGIYKEYHKNEDNFGKSTRGYTYTYHAKYLLPEIYATLRLKINGVIQKFLNKIDENFGKIDVYT